MVVNVKNQTGKPGSRLAALAVILSVMASSATALPALNQDAHINASLIAAAIGDQIRKKCSTISPRYFVVISSAKKLERYAVGLGYSEKQIDAFLDNKAEKKRIRKAAQTYLDDHGVVKGNEASYCSLGKTEIANGTLTGKLLRAR